MKAPLENPLFLSPIRPLLAALFLTSPVAYALKENFLSFEGVFPLDFPVLPEEALRVLVASFLLFLYSLFRAIQALTRLRARAALAGFPSEFLSSERLYRLIKHIPADSVYLGRGFVWTPELANTAYRLTDAPLNPYTIPASLRALLTGTRGKDVEAIGQGWLHGIGPSEGPVFLTGKAADGGTLIVGTTQSGKGVLLTLLISEAIFRGEPVLIIDPKNSPRTLAALQKATEIARAASCVSPDIRHRSAHESAYKLRTSFGNCEPHHVVLERNRALCRLCLEGRLYGRLFTSCLRKADHLSGSFRGLGGRPD